MGKSERALPKGITNKIDETIKKYESHERYPKDDGVIMDLFKKYKQNDSFEPVFIKTCALNTLYATRIRADQIVKMADYISKIKDLDDYLKAGKLDAFDKIAVTPKEINNAPVFASKFCHFHNPKAFPIFDSRSRASLVDINKQLKFTDPFEEKEILVYRVFKEKLDTFLGVLDKSYTYKQIDEFLWYWKKDEQKNVH